MQQATQDAEAARQRAAFAALQSYEAELSQVAELMQATMDTLVSLLAVQFATIATIGQRDAVLSAGRCLHYSHGCRLPTLSVIVMHRLLWTMWRC